MASCYGSTDTDWVDNLTLHEMFRVVGDQMSDRDVRVLKYLYNGVLSESIKTKIKDGYSFLLALEKIGRVDESSFKHLLQALRIITRHDLMQFVTVRPRKTVEQDPVDQYLEETARTNTIIPTCLKRKHFCVEEEPLPGPSGVQDSWTKSTNSYDSYNYHQGVSPPSDEVNHHRAESGVGDSHQGAAATAVPSNEADLPPSNRKRLTAIRKRRKGYRRSLQSEGMDDSWENAEKDSQRKEIRKKVTCDIRLRVRAEYCQHDNALEGNIFSNKPELIERQFEKFTQANTILKARDLGSIICDIKFSELTYLDAFWRDYINGSLLEALKGVFITESLKQAVGHEAIKLLVNVDEDDYEAGRLKLLQNLRE